LFDQVLYDGEYEELGSTFRHYVRLGLAVLKGHLFTMAADKTVALNIDFQEDEE
jgi:hypothetical protein